MDTLEEANKAIRDAVTTRLAGTPADDPKMTGYTPPESCCEGGKCQPKIPADWILRGERELEEQRMRGDGVLNAGSETYSEWQPPAYADGMRPGSKEFLSVLEELKTLHLKKTLDYGVDEDALSNIRSSADIVNMPAWAGCILRISDKMHRIKAFFRRGKVEFDGIEDTLKDIACYAAIALVLHRESERP